MSKLAEHPAVKNFYENRSAEPPLQASKRINSEWLKEMCLAMGADAVGFVDIDRESITEHKKDILDVYPRTKTVIVIASKMNRENVRAPFRNIANVEYHKTEDNLNEIGRKISTKLLHKSVRSMNLSGAFPFEMERWADEGKIWLVALKPLAQEAGLGWMGHHRMVIHPKFGSAMFLNAILIDTELTTYDKPLTHSPCIECQLCVASCPTGAISADGHFDFSSCITHNYREKLGGFSDWVENIVQSKTVGDYRGRVSDSETLSMWQSLSSKANTKCDYCMAVCPAGDDLLGDYLKDRKDYLATVVKPHQKKEEKVYVLKGSDAEAYVAKRFPHKEVRRVGNGIRAASIEKFLEALPRLFQRGQSEGLTAVYHFSFTGNETAEATVTIKDKTISVKNGHAGKANLRVIADSGTWLKFLAKEKNIVLAIISRKIKVKGSPRLLLAFGKCFPS
ncbi:Iron-sulfur cluster-binding protein [hydrothermal vent metagenome]|uniref:Iron-sulfur cluster-binding protein n=1 Tax=hydrothermal vent metagenome TaxID=652676 RepID=A0A3B1CIG8_9ZZZZ